MASADVELLVFANLMAVAFDGGNRRDYSY
jgi:hypothetical protein